MKLHPTREVYHITHSMLHSTKIEVVYENLPMLHPLLVTVTSNKIRVESCTSSLRTLQPEDDEGIRKVGADVAEYSNGPSSSSPGSSRPTTTGTVVAHADRTMEEVAEEAGEGFAAYCRRGKGRNRQAASVTLGGCSPSSMPGDGGPPRRLLALASTMAATQQWAALYPPPTCAFPNPQLRVAPTSSAPRTPPSSARRSSSSASTSTAPICPVSSLPDLAFLHLNSNRFYEVGALWRGWAWSRVAPAAVGEAGGRAEGGACRRWWGRLGKAPRRRRGGRRRAGLRWGRETHEKRDKERWAWTCQWIR